MICPKCGSEAVNVSLEQVSAKTHNFAISCLRIIGRWLLIICTYGLWLLVKRKKGTSKTKFKLETFAVCQNCGHSWRV